MSKVCEMTKVREWGEGSPVELWREDDNGRLVIRAYSECGNSTVDIDLLDLIAWCQGGSQEAKEIYAGALFGQHVTAVGVGGA